MPASATPELPSSAPRNRDAAPPVAPDAPARGGEPRIWDYPRLDDHVAAYRGKGHTANCPRFFDRFPWECDCQTEAAN